MTDIDAKLKIRIGEMIQKYLLPEGGNYVTMGFILIVCYEWAPNGEVVRTKSFIVSTATQFIYFGQ